MGEGLNLEPYYQAGPLVDAPFLEPAGKFAGYTSFVWYMYSSPAVKLARPMTPYPVYYRSQVGMVRQGNHRDA